MSTTKPAASVAQPRSTGPRTCRLASCFGAEKSGSLEVNSCASSHSSNVCRRAWYVLCSMHVLLAQLTRMWFYRESCKAGSVLSVFSSFWPSINSPGVCWLHCLSSAPYFASLGLPVSMFCSPSSSNYCLHNHQCDIWPCHLHLLKTLSRFLIVYKTIFLNNSFIEI